METTAMTTSIKNIHSIFSLNTRLFLNALEELTEAQVKERISEHNNPISWIATHTIWARYNVSMLLGIPVQNPYKGLFENFKAYDVTMDLPSLATLKSEWQKASEHLEKAFEQVTEAHLAADGPFKNPIGDDSNAGTIAFLAQHESYDIGQIAFLKKYYTKQAMKY